MRLQASGLLEPIGPRQRIAVTVGSRGIHTIATVLRTVIAVVRERGATPFLGAAMGSHGGAATAGQVVLLLELGITEESIGAPIQATMEFVPLGQLPDGPRLLMDAAAAGGIIVGNRIKPHSDFHGPSESGSAKMTVCSLGKRHGADAIYTYGAPGLRELLPAAVAVLRGRPRWIAHAPSAQAAGTLRPSNR